MEATNRWVRIKGAYEKLCALMLFLGVSISMAEVIARVFFRVSFDLFFDFSIWCTVWAVLLIAGPLILEDGHVFIGFIRENAHGRVRLFIEVFNNFFILAFGAAITWGGILFIGGLYTRKSVFPRILPIPMWMVELCVPIGMGLFTVCGLVYLYRIFRQKW